MKMAPANHRIYGITVDGVVRYVGRTLSKHRFAQHLNEARRLLEKRVTKTHWKRVQPFHKWLGSAIAAGSSIEEILIDSGLTLEASALREIEVIASFPEGQLWNRHVGGLGGSSAASNRAVSKKWAEDTVFRERQSAQARETLAKTMSDPAIAQKRIDAVKASWTPERRAARSAASKAMAADPEFQARRLAAASAAAKKKWADPEYRARKTAQLRETAIKRWKDPVYRDHTLKVLLRRYSNA